MSRRRSALTGPATADEGDTKTYFFTVSDPGTDTFTVDEGFPDCDSAATNNGVYVAGSIAVNAGGGSFECFFADGPATASVKMKVTDSDGASDTDLELVQVVAVANVAPSVTAPANQTAAEGALEELQASVRLPIRAPTARGRSTSTGATARPTRRLTPPSTGSLGSRSHTYADGPARCTVSVKVTDKNGDSDTKTFTVTVANVAPTVTLDAGNDLSVNEGSTEHTYSYTISDPGTDTVSARWRRPAAPTAARSPVRTPTRTRPARSSARSLMGPRARWCRPPRPIPIARPGNLATQSVAVANVAPTVSVTGPATADEGDTKTYSFTVTDPGADTFTVDGGFPDCDSAATNNGSYVAGSIAVNAGGGSFDCFFADGPATASVKMKVTDSDGASDTDFGARAGRRRSPMSRRA